ncbi:MAG: saccharopine dehydrogenase NADP-binding domain-containing protein [Nitrososphaerota archaeon]|nr:saccharopine dehydrogenase NADP-binding domain-containing protein [Nitrososphaerota archaeon]
MKAAVLGSGMMGSVIALDLAASDGVDEVVVADIDEGRLEALKKRAPGKKLSVEHLDMMRPGQGGVVPETLRRGGVGAPPWRRPSV